MGKVRCRVLSVLVFLTILSINHFGCKATYHYQTADEVALKTQIDRDNFLQQTTVTGPYANTADKKAMYLLTAKFQNKEMIECEVIIYQSRTRELGPAYYYEAFDPQDNQLEVSHYYDTFSAADEKIGVKVPKEFLYASKDTGLVLKLFGKRDDLSVKVEGFYIQGFLAKATEAG